MQLLYIRLRFYRTIQLIMIKKLSFLALIVLGLSFSIQAQDVDQRLLSKYSSIELANLKSSNLAEYEFEVYCLDHAITKAKYSTEKGGTYPEINMPSASSTYLDLGLKILKDKNQVFKISGTDELLVVKSELVLRLNYKNSKK